MQVEQVVVCRDADDVIIFHSV